MADYTVMLMLMAIRHAKSIVRRTDIHDYRLHDVRGKELRDLTVGVVGTGRIGQAVLDRCAGSAARYWRMIGVLTAMPSMSCSTTF